MADDILDHVAFIIVVLVTGAVLIILGLAFHIGIFILVGAVFDGAIPVLKLVQWIFEEYG